MPRYHILGVGGGLVTKLCPTLATTWTIACKAPLSIGFSKQEYWAGLHFLFRGPSQPSNWTWGLLHCRQIFLPTELWGKPHILGVCVLNYLTDHNSDNNCVRFISVLLSMAQLSLTLGDPMYCSTPGLPVHHQLPEFTQTHVHWVGDAIQPSHPLSSPSPPAPNPSQHQGLF